MNDRLKRVIAIIALILLGIFSVSFIIYLFDNTLLNGAIGDIAIWSGGFGLLLFIVLWISRAFPSQQVKDEERERLYKEAEEQEETNKAATEESDDSPKESEQALSEEKKEDSTFP